MSFLIEHTEQLDLLAHVRAADTSKSLKSWAGVILTAPVPFSGSEYSSAMIGMRRPTSGRMACFPTRCRYRSSSGCTATATSPSMVSGRVVATVMKSRVVRIESGALQRVTDVPQMAVYLDLLHFKIGNGGQQLRVPVDQALVLVDEPGAIKLDEHLEHRARESLIHCELLARPVAGSTEPFELRGDRAAGFRLPGPDLFQKFFAPERAAPGSCRSISWRSTTICVAMPAWSVPGCQSTSRPCMRSKRQNVLQRVVERMTHMQRSRDIRRRDHDAIGFGATALGPPARKAPASSHWRRCAPRLRRAGMSCRSLSAASGDLPVKSPPPFACQRCRANASVCRRRARRFR